MEGVGYDWVSGRTKRAGSRGTPKASGNRVVARVRVYENYCEKNPVRPYRLKELKGGEDNDEAVLETFSSENS